MAKLLQKTKNWGVGEKIIKIVFCVAVVFVGFSLGEDVYAAPSWTSGIVPSSGGTRGGSALQFDGASSYVDIGNVGNIQTVEFWINDSNATDGILELINNSTYVSISGSAITATGFTSPTIYVNGSSASASLVSGWNHVVITNTAQVAAASFLIGEANNDYLSGKIDEVRIYDRALSAAEVRYHYNKGGPVAYWKFDDGSGSTAYDETPNNNDGTLYGEMATSTTYGWITGKYGSALSFDGVDDYVDAGNAGSNVRTISFWLKRGNTLDRDVIDLGTPEIKISSNAITSTNLTSPTYYVDAIQGATAVSANVWHHITIVDTSNISASNIDIGKASASYFYGLIDDVRIYNYARTPDEIRLDYNAGFKAKF